MDRRKGRAALKANFDTCCRDEVVNGRGEPLLVDTEERRSGPVLHPYRRKDGAWIAIRAIRVIEPK